MLKDFKLFRTILKPFFISWDFKRFQSLFSLQNNNRRRCRGRSLVRISGPIFLRVGCSAKWTSERVRVLEKTRKRGDVLKKEERTREEKDLAAGYSIFQSFNLFFDLRVHRPPTPAHFGAYIFISIQGGSFFFSSCSSALLHLVPTRYILDLSRERILCVCVCVCVNIYGWGFRGTNPWHDVVAFKKFTPPLMCTFLYALILHSTHSLS